jgi:hypothetical protein
MADNAKSGGELLGLILEFLPPGRFYTSSEIFTFIKDRGLLNDADLALHKGGEITAYRRLQNAIRDGKKKGVLEQNDESIPFQYRVVSIRP